MTGSSGTIVAKVRKIVAGHSERSLVHAVEDSGLEHKLELSTEVLRTVNVGQDHVLMISWSLQALPQVPAGPSAAPIATGPSATPKAGGEASTVDEEFMAMMARGRRATGTAAAAPAPRGVGTPPAPTSAGSTTDDEFMALMGRRSTEGKKATLLTAQLTNAKISASEAKDAAAELASQASKGGWIVEQLEVTSSNVVGGIQTPGNPELQKQAQWSEVHILDVRLRHPNISGQEAKDVQAEIIQQAKQGHWTIVNIQLGTPTAIASPAMGDVTAPVGSAAQQVAAMLGLRPGSTAS